MKEVRTVICHSMPAGLVDMGSYVAESFFFGSQTGLISIYRDSELLANGGHDHAEKSIRRCGPISAITLT